MSPPSRRILLTLLICVVMALKLCLSPISVLCRDMEHLLKKVGKGYDCGALFRLSYVDDVCNKVVKNVNVSDESNIWHSRLCHINFGCLTWLVNLNLILKFNFVKDSKCQVCVQLK